MASSTDASPLLVHVLPPADVPWAEALSDGYRIVALADSQVLLSPFWTAVLEVPADQLDGRRVVALLPLDYTTVMASSSFGLATERVTLWLAEDGEAVDRLSGLGLAAAYLPPVVEVAEQVASRPSDGQFVGSFHASTISGEAATEANRLLTVLVSQLRAEGRPVEVLLAGERAELVGLLAAAGVPHQTLPARSAGLAQTSVVVAPGRDGADQRAVLDALVAGCPVIARADAPVGDVLPNEYRFADATAALELLRRLFDEGPERGFWRSLSATVTEQFGAEARHQALRTALDQAAELPALDAAKLVRMVPAPQPLTGWRGLLARVSRFASPRPDERLCVGVWHKFMKPPFGGGNQFMLALCEGLKQRGVRIIANKYTELVDVWLLNSMWFDVDRFLAWYAHQPRGVVHRIDGPIQLIRGKDPQLDELTFDLNRKLATRTVMQSVWSYQETLSLGFRPIRASVIRNAVNPNIFHSHERRERRPGEKLKIIASSWSANQRKGGPVYRWLEQHLDWERFEFTFVGNVSEPLERARHLGALPSEGLADELRQHDIYLTASQRDPCSNAVVEALACGLPVVYLNDGGHPELVGQGGVAFTGPDDLLDSLDRVAADYEVYRSLVQATAYDEVVDRYLDLLRAAAEAPRTESADGC